MMKKATRHRGIKPSSGSERVLLAVSRGFTLTELMIAVVVLLVVIAATGKIFDTVTKVTGLSEATQDVLQEASAIERQLRPDFEAIAPEGFVAIRQVRVRNDINFATTGTLLDPSLSPLHYFRADQIVFFTNSLANAQTYRLSEGSYHKGQGTVAFEYFGPGFQLLNASAAQILPGDIVQAHDASPALTVFPWTNGNIDMVRTRIKTIGGTGPATDIYTATPAGQINATQPPPNQWLLVRQQALLADDDDNAPNSNSKTVYLQNQASRSIFMSDPFIGNFRSPQLRDSRADVASTLMHQIRNRIEFVGTTYQNWASQRARIGDSMQYRRAERVAPSMHRVDQALTNGVIASGCSSVRIDWTYDPGVGFADRDGITGNGNEFRGFNVDPRLETPWFGLADLGNDQRGVFPFFNYTAPQSIETIFPNNIEQLVVDTPTLQVYEAIFGYNQTQALNAAGNPDVNMIYTPWPSAVRITLTLHDTNVRLPQGREVQFVLRLPKRAGV